MTVSSLYKTQFADGCQQNPSTFVADGVSHFFDAYIPETDPRSLRETLFDFKSRKRLINFSIDSYKHKETEKIHK